MRWEGYFEDEEGAPLPEPLQKAAHAVLDRMSGCPLPNCHACEANRVAIADLITEARRTARAAT